MSNEISVGDSVKFKKTMVRTKDSHIFMGEQEGIVEAILDDGYLVKELPVLESIPNVVLVKDLELL